MHHLLILIALLFAAAAAPAQGPLEAYVKKDDGQFSWRVVKSVKANDYTGHVLYLSSQEWRTGQDVERVLWRHWLVVVVPKTVTADTALLQIGSGVLDYTIPDSVDPALVQIARESGTVVAQLRQVPVQPVYFMGEDRLVARSEDELLAYTFRKFLEGGDAEWPALLPMVKSVVKAMDAIQSFTKSSAGGGRRAERFVLTGASKRGWTAYLAAAVDPRVAGIAPQVIDLLAMESSIPAQRDAYGRYSESLEPYQREKVLDALGTPRGQELAAIIDPFKYREKLQMPKLLLHAPGDEFWLPDSTRFYLAKLPGQNHLRNILGKGHNLDGSEDERAIATFHRAIAHKKELPSITTVWPAEGQVEVTPSVAAKEVRLWRATNSQRRDFRLAAVPASAWTQVPVSKGKDGVYRAQAVKPQSGFTAYFVEVIFADPFGGDRDWVVSSEVRVLGTK